MGEKKNAREVLAEAFVKKMSSSLSDVEDQSSSAQAFFQHIPLKNNTEHLLHHSSPESSFYVIKNPQQSSVLPCGTTPTSRPGNARTLFSVIHPMPQETTNKINVRYLTLFAR